MTGRPRPAPAFFVLYYLLGLVLGCFLLLQIPAIGTKEPPRIAYIGERTFARAAGPVAASAPTAGAPSAEAPPVSTALLDAEFNGVLLGRPSGRGERSVALSNGRRFPLVEPDRAHVPFVGFGFLRYVKVAGGISHVSPTGELLWKKDHPVYPYADPTGKLLLFVSGDSNDIILSDENGTTVATSSGDFLSQHCFASRELRVGLVFSGTSFRVLDSRGTVMLDWKPSGRFFLKSCALSSDGKRAALHYDRAGTDHISLFRIAPGDSGRTDTIALPKLYPHLLHLAVGPGGLLLGAPDQVAFFDDDGDLEWARPAPTAGFYRPVFADVDLFVYGNDDEAVFLDGRGRELARARVQSGGGAWRVHRGRSTGVFALQGADSVAFFRHTPQRD